MSIQNSETALALFVIPQGGQPDCQLSGLAGLESRLQGSSGPQCTALKAVWAFGGVLKRTLQVSEWIETKWRKTGKLHWNREDDALLCVWFCHTTLALAGTLPFRSSAHGRVLALNQKVATPLALLRFSLRAAAPGFCVRGTLRPLVTLNFHSS